MATEQFFKFCQDGDLEGLQTFLNNEENQIDINTKDVHEMSGLAYSARNGHVEIVRELLQRGAEKQEVLEQGYGLNNEEIAKLLQDNAQEGGENNVQGDVNNEGEQYLPVDMHGGQQLPDGTISYMNAASNFGQGYGFPPPQQFAGHQFPHQFFPVEEMHAGAPIFQPGSANGVNRRGHGRKESGINLPPPEVARMIPCKYFPNCKYGEKCVFAHPIPIGAIPLPPQGHPLSPSSSHQSPMQPMFYGQMPPGYPYPPYGAVPQQFLPSGTPMGPPESMQPFGDFAGHPIVSHQQTQYPHSAPVGSTEFVTENGEGKRVEGEGGNETEEDGRVNGNAEQNGEGAEPSSSTALDSTSQDLASSASANGKPLHRRQSFNSFLHHHAVPFQPQSMIAGLDMNNAMMNGIANGFVPRSSMHMQNKGRRMNGINGNNLNGNFNGKRGMMNGDKPPCTFFQSGRCKYGNDCRFPHLLPDGSDVRSVQAQQRQNFSAQPSPSAGTPSNVSTPNVPQPSEEPAKSAETPAESAPALTTPTTNGNVNAPVSAPTAPQADKRQQQQSSQQQQQQTQPSQSQPQSSNKPSQGSGSQTKNKGSGQSNGIVRSNPSKTSIQANGQHNNNNNNNNNHGGSGSRGNKKGNHNNNNQNQQAQKPSQRVPTVNDFPALSSPNPSGSNATSPLPSSANVTSANGNASNSIDTNATPSSSTNGVLASPSGPTTPAVPIKANFSAILSAPAPVKPVKSETNVNGTDESNTTKSDESTTAANGKVEGEEKPVQVAKTHASVAAAAAAANAPVVNGTLTKSQQQNVQPKANGKGGNNNNKEKQLARQKAAAAANATPAVNKTNGSAVELDDDFQLVNRSRHSTHKRPSNGNNSNGKNGGGGETFAPQAKAVVA